MATVRRLKNKSSNRKTSLPAVSMRILFLLIISVVVLLSVPPYASAQESEATDDVNNNNGYPDDWYVTSEPGLGACYDTLSQTCGCAADECSEAQCAGVWSTECVLSCDPAQCPGVEGATSAAGMADLFEQVVSSVCAFVVTVIPPAAVACPTLGIEGGSADDSFFDDDLTYDDDFLTDDDFFADDDSVTDNNNDESTDVVDENESSGDGGNGNGGDGTTDGNGGGGGEATNSGDGDGDGEDGDETTDSGDGDETTTDTGNGDETTTDAGGEDQDQTTIDNGDNDKNIVDTAINMKALSSIVSLLKTAELESYLSLPGPYTLFAPTNAAFLQVDDELNAIIANDKAVLTELLLNHVVKGTFRSSDFVDGASLSTTDGTGGILSVKLMGNDVVMINEARVVTADIATSNGVIHVVDSVLLTLSSSSGEGEDGVQQVTTDDEQNSSADDEQNNSVVVNGVVTEDSDSPAAMLSLGFFATGGVCVVTILFSLFL